MTKTLIPLWGVILGAMGAVIYLQLSKAVPMAIAELAVAILWGALAFAPREDPKFGIAPLAILAAGIAVRWMALNTPMTPVIMMAGIASQTVARSAMIGLAWVSRPAGNGTAKRLGENLTIPAAILTMAIGTAAAFYAGLQIGLLIVAIVYLIIRAVRWVSYRYLGGVTGDSLGLTQLLTELLILLVFAQLARSLAYLASKVVT